MNRDDMAVDGSDTLTGTEPNYFEIARREAVKGALTSFYNAGLDAGLRGMGQAGRPNRADYDDAWLSGFRTGQAKRIELMCIRPKLGEE